VSAGIGAPSDVTPWIEWTPMMPYQDRRHAGQSLAAQLGRYANRSDVVVLALARGGVTIGAELAQALHAPLDVMVVHKVFAPGTDELPIAIIASGGVGIFDPAAIGIHRLPFAAVDGIMARARRALEEQEQAYRQVRPAAALEGQTVILTYDGLVTGASMLTAIAAVRTRKPARVVVAVPVASQDAYRAVAHAADACICLDTPHPYFRTGIWYEDFARVTDAEIIRIFREGATATRVAA
jgi:putative phosphoribosyl transferase